MAGKNPFSAMLGKKQGGYPLGGGEGSCGGGGEGSCGSSGTPEAPRIPRTPREDDPTLPEGVQLNPAELAPTPPPLDVTGLAAMMAKMVPQQTDGLAQGRTDEVPRALRGENENYLSGMGRSWR